MIEQEGVKGRIMTEMTPILPWVFDSMQAICWPNQTREGTNKVLELFQRLTQWDKRQTRMPTK